MGEYPYLDAKPRCSSRYLMPALLEILRDVPPRAVVADVGCGNGSKLAQFLDRGWDLHGLEISRSGLAAAARLTPRSISNGGISRRTFPRILSRASATW